MKKFAFTLIIVALYIYVGLPTFYIGFHGVPFLILLILGSLYGWRVYLRSNSSSYEDSEGRNYLAITFFTYLAIYLITVGASTMSLFRSGDYQEQIGEVKIAKDLEEHMAPISTEEIIIVDKSIAYRLGDKVIGADPSLGSQTELGDFTLQKINDKLYWVAPLLHSGFFKWFNHKEGTPGYIRVSATNERDVELIQSYDGKPIRLKYQTQAFSLSNLARHVYFNGYMNKGLTDFSFETDDKGRPYWVVTIYDNEVGFAGQEATGVLTVDPESGEITEYTIEDAPKWVDRIQPDDFVITQLNNWGEYINGYWNFSNNGKLKTTNGVTLVYGPDNESYWYTGLTSVGKDEGTVGFALVNTRTKETFWYKHIGATEEAAQQSAMGKVQEKGYVATFPVTYNINGVPTYVMSLKDQAGLIKMIAMVSVEDYTIVGVGNTAQECLRSYKSILNSNSNDIEVTSQQTHNTINGKVSRFASDTRDGNTYYYLKLNNFDKTFIGTSLSSTSIILTHESDSVSVSYDNANTQLIDIVRFQNLTLGDK